VNNWCTQRSRIAGGEKLQIFSGDAQLSVREMLELMAADTQFADWYSELLAALPYKAFFWENPAICSDTLDEQAEIVVINARTLDWFRADGQPFEDQFTDLPNDIVTFRSLGGDATLVAPCPNERPSSCAHLATFVRKASREQQRKMWQTVGSTVLNSISNDFIWLSTSGLGVAWLHVRLDSAPKYYQHLPYKTSVLH